MMANPTNTNGCILSDPRLFNGESVRILPNRIRDKDILSDASGNVYQFNSEEKSWISKGQIPDPDLVTEQKDGLVSSEIFDRIESIRRLIDAGISFDRTKPFSGKEFGYFYYLYSSDNLIVFKPEFRNEALKLVMEVNKPRLIRRLRSFSCNGPKGFIGPKGPSGPRAEQPFPDEVFQKPTDIDGDTLRLSVAVPKPIDTPISLRLFENQIRKAEFLVPTIAGQDVQITTFDDFTIDLSATEVEYNKDSQILSAVIVATDIEFDRSWTFKARQVGLKGPRGDDGRNILEIRTQVTNDLAVRFKQAIVSMRISINNVFFFRKPISEEICVPQISHVTGLPIGDIENQNLVAVENGTFSCKDLGFFKFTPEVSKPRLILPQWTPTKGCVDRRTFFLSLWDWTKVAKPSLPFKILIDPESTEQVCKSQFFTCPNEGDIGSLT